MIYDIVNAIVYVALARLFCSTFLDLEDHSVIVNTVTTILWIIASFGVGTYFEGSLVFRIIIVIAINIVFSLVLYKKKNKMMIIAIPTLFYIIAIACDFFIAAIHRYFDPNLKIAQIMESDISVYMGAASQFIQFVIVFIIHKAFRKEQTTKIETKLWLIYMVFPLYSLSLIALFAYSFNGPINIYQGNLFTYVAISLLLINLFIFWFCVIL